ncbi:MOP flippase family protein [Rathayibacter toxicus]|uniref:MOP flippase family protein n=1 Tax=Rathayibacter toxicus TaxID=145458 RepID=UPI000CE85F93|nr:MOP flippase family protein [Rathayibacter toxicus]QOD10588.1 MOP flippase family protein [Rathayibacter toxicus]QWL27320.1 MOP flippase family protein [Rathayibacter toxicus]
MKAASAAKWSGVSAVVMALSQLLVNGVLARIVDPHQMGLVVIVNYFYLFVDVFVGLGLTAALIQRRQVTSRELASVHWANVLLVLIAFVLASGLSAPIAEALGAPDAQPLLVVSALAFVFTACGQASRAVLEKRLDFRPLGIADTLFGATLLVVAVVLALLGVGAMSAAIALVAAAAMRSLIFLLAARHIVRLRWHFRISDTRRFFSYGVWQALDGVLNYTSNTLAGLSTSRVVSTAALGGFGNASNIGISIPSRLGPILTRVLFPYFSLIQHDRRRIEQDYLKMLTLFGVTMGPLLACIAATASDVMTVIYGPNWTSFGPVLAILCLAGWIRSLGYPVGSLLAATDNLRLGVALNIGLTALNVPLILACTLLGGVQGAAWSMVAMGVISYIAGYWCLRRVTGARVSSYLRATAPAFILPIAPALVVLVLGVFLAEAPLPLRLALQIVAAVVTLAVAASMSRHESVRFFTGVVRGLIVRAPRYRIAVLLPANERFDGTGGAIASWVRNTYSVPEAPRDHAVFCPAGGGTFAAGTQRVRLPLIDRIDALVRALARPVGRAVKRNPNGIFRILSCGGRLWIWAVYPRVAGAESIHLHNEPSYAVQLRRLGYTGRIVMHMHNDAVAPVRVLTGRKMQTSDVVGSIDAWLFCSEYLAETARRELGLDAPITVVHNGATLPGATPSFHSRPGTPARLSFAGRLIEDKGVLEAVLAVGALAQRMPVTFDIFGGKATGNSHGESPYIRQVRAAAAEITAAQPQSSIRLRGFVSPETLAEELAASDLFLYPCRWEEPFGMVLLDAMNVGTPAVAVRRGGIPEIVTTDSGGMLVGASATAEELATAMEAVLTDPEYAARRSAAFTVARQRFSWEQVADTLSEAFDALDASYAETGSSRIIARSAAL